MKRVAELAGFFIGIATVSFGIWQIYGPAGFIAIGLLLMTFALLSRRSNA